MASVHKHIRSGTASKRPTTAIAEGQIALATNITSPGLFFKDSTGATIVKIGPVHVGTTAPNATPAGSAGNSIGEVWLDTSLTPVGVKIYNGTAFVNATPIGSTTVEGLLELATNAETQTGSDTARAVTSAGLQSKLSDSTSTTSATTIASSTAVKAAFDLAGLALPKTGGTVTGNLEIGTAGSLSFEGATADGFETTIAVVDPTADRTITLPNTTGTVVTTGDTGTVTSTMLLDGTILNEDINASAAIAYSKLATLSSANIVLGSSANVATSTAVTGDVTIGNTGVTAIATGVIVNADINASAAIVDTKLATIATAGKVSNSATTATNANTASAIVARDASGNFTAGTITAALTGNASTVTTNANLTGDVTSTGNATAIAAGVIVNADVSASAAIAGTKIAPNFGAQTITTTGVISPALGTAALPSVAFTGDLNTGIFSPGADQVAISTNGVQRLNIEADGDINIDGGGVFYDATNNRLAIGTLLPSNQLTIASNTLSAITLDWVGDNLPKATFSANHATGEVRMGATNNSGTYFTTFYSNNTERLRITSAGNVGIGTSNPGSTLSVSAAPDTVGTTNGANFSILNPGLTVNQINSTTIGIGVGGIVDNFAGDLHLRSFWGSSIDKGAGNFSSGASNSVNADSRTFAIRQFAGGTTWNTQFCVNDSGNVGIGTTSPANQLQLSTDSAGKPSTNTWTIVSDERIKEEIELADLNLCYQAVKNIPLKRFKWKDEVYTEEQVRDRRKLGWIAQDVEAVFPKAVGTYEFKYNQVFEETIVPAVEEELDDEGNVTTPGQPERIEKGELISEDVIEDCRDLNSDQLYAAMYGAIQKLMIKVEALETEVAALKAA